MNIYDECYSDKKIEIMTKRKTTTNKQTKKNITGNEEWIKKTKFDWKQKWIEKKTYVVSFGSEAFDFFSQVHRHRWDMRCSEWTKWHLFLFTCSVGLHPYLYVLQGSFKKLMLFATTPDMASIAIHMMSSNQAPTHCPRIGLKSWELQSNMHSFDETYKMALILCDWNINAYIFMRIYIIYSWAPFSNLDDLSTRVVSRS